MTFMKSRSYRRWKASSASARAAGFISRSGKCRQKLMGTRSTGRPASAACTRSRLVMGDSTPPSPHAHVRGPDRLVRRRLPYEALRQAVDVGLPVQEGPRRIVVKDPRRLVEEIPALLNLHGGVGSVQQAVELRTLVVRVGAPLIDQREKPPGV